MEIGSETDCSVWNTSKSILYKRRRGQTSSLTISVSPSVCLADNLCAAYPFDEYLETASKRLTIDELHQYAQDTISIYQEFWSTPTNTFDKQRICGIGIKNRYKTIFANEHSRVKLNVLADDPVASYINANYVHGWPNDPHAFIATQGPLSNTVVDFYWMIWQEHVPVIVMITQLFEKNKAKCERYIPESDKIRYGPFDIKIKTTIYENNYEKRRLIIIYENQQREVDHYWYKGWYDQSIPDAKQPILDLVHSVEISRNELSIINAKAGPVVVHCSAGVGRTGCFIALCNGIKQLEKERVVDVVRILCDLRRDRGGMIQTIDQYQFLYQALSEYAQTLQ